MDLVDLVLIARRRWYVVLPMVLLTAAAALFARASVEITYRADGSLLLFAPRAPDSSTNPFLGFNNLSIPANVVVEVVDGIDVRERLADEGAADDYEVGLDPSNPAPLIIVIAEGGKEQAPMTVRRVLKELDDELMRRQEALGAPRESWITTGIVRLPEDPVEDSGSRTRAFIAVLFLGCAVTGGVTILVNAVLEGRAVRRRPAGDGDEPSAGAAPGPVAVPPDDSRRVTAPQWAPESRRPPGAVTPGPAPPSRPEPGEPRRVPMPQAENAAPVADGPSHQAGAAPAHQPSLASPARPATRPPRQPQAQAQRDLRGPQQPVPEATPAPRPQPQPSAPPGQPVRAPQPQPQPQPSAPPGQPVRAPQPQPGGAPPEPLPRVPPEPQPQAQPPTPPQPPSQATPPPQPPRPGPNPRGADGGGQPTRRRHPYVVAVDESETANRDPGEADAQ